MYLLDVGSFCSFERNGRLGGRVPELGLSRSEFLLHLAGSINQPRTQFKKANNDALCFEAYLPYLDSAEPALTTPKRQAPLLPRCPHQHHRRVEFPSGLLNLSGDVLD